MSLHYQSNSLEPRRPHNSLAYQPHTKDEDLPPSSYSSFSFHQSDYHGLGVTGPEPFEPSHSNHQPPSHHFDYSPHASARDSYARPETTPSTGYHAPTPSSYHSPSSFHSSRYSPSPTPSSHHQPSPTPDYQTPTPPSYNHVHPSNESPSPTPKSYHSPSPTPTSIYDSPSPTPSHYSATPIYDPPTPSPTPASRYHSPAVAPAPADYPNPEHTRHSRLASPTMEPYLSPPNPSHSHQEENAAGEYSRVQEPELQEEKDVRFSRQAELKLGSHLTSGKCQEPPITTRCPIFRNTSK